MRINMLSRIVGAGVAAMLVSHLVMAQANLEVNTPAVTSIKADLRQHFGELKEYFATGAIGLTRDGLLAVRDANAIPLAQRQQVNALVAADNQDRIALYREIARANGKPEWENDIRATFAQRWIERAHAGWYYQNSAGIWTRK